MLIKDLKLTHGEIITCDITDGSRVHKQIECMVVIEKERMYLFQNYAGGSAPSNFADINNLFGTSYLGCWSVGYIDENKDRNVTNIKTTGKIKSPANFSRGEVYINKLGHKFIIDKYLPKSNTIYLRDEKGVISKMLDISAMRYDLQREDTFKPLTAKDIEESFYNEDLFKLMIYKDPYKNKKKRGMEPATTWPTNGILFNSMAGLGDVGITYHRAVDTPTITPETRIRWVETSIRGHYADIYNFINIQQSIRYQIRVNPNMSATVLRGNNREIELYEEDIRRSRESIVRDVIKRDELYRESGLGKPHIINIEIEGLKRTQSSLERRIQGLNANIDTYNRQLLSGTLSTTRTTLTIASRDENVKKLAGLNESYEYNKVVLDNLIQDATRAGVLTPEIPIQNTPMAAAVATPVDDGFWGDIELNFEGGDDIDTDDFI